MQKQFGAAKRQRFLCMYEILIEERLRETLSKLYKKDRKRYDICMKKIEDIANNPEQYKPLRYDLKNIRRVHVAKSFVLIFKVEGNNVKFLEMDHHDNIYKR
ncbi:MAG: type II toxin-antitoxin system RelE/ParE family toxin [Candidatus Aenigmatarchaeota archaeon]